MYDLDTAHIHVIVLSNHVAEAWHRQLAHTATCCESWHVFIRHRPEAIGVEAADEQCACYVEVHGMSWIRYVST